MHPCGLRLEVAQGELAVDLADHAGSVRIGPAPSQQRHRQASRSTILDDRPDVTILAVFYDVDRVQAEQVAEDPLHDLERALMLLEGCRDDAPTL